MATYKRGKRQDRTKKITRTKHTPHVYKFTGSYTYQAGVLLDAECKESKINIITWGTCETIKDMTIEYATEQCPQGMMLLQSYRVNAREVAKADKNGKPHGLRTVEFTAGEEIHEIITMYWRNQNTCEVLKPEKGKATKAAKVLPVRTREVVPLVETGDFQLNVQEQSSNGKEEPDTNTNLMWSKFYEEAKGKDDREFDLHLYRTYADHFPTIPPDIFFKETGHTRSGPSYYRSILEDEGYVFRKSTKYPVLHWEHGRGTHAFWDVIERPPSREKRKERAEEMFANVKLEHQELVLETLRELMEKNIQ